MSSVFGTLQSLKRFYGIAFEERCYQRKKAFAETIKKVEESGEAMKTIQKGW